MIHYTPPQAGDVSSTDQNTWFGDFDCTILFIVYNFFQFSSELVNLEFKSGALCTINISDAEGFGLATLESLAYQTKDIIDVMERDSNLKLKSVNS